MPPLRRVSSAAGCRSQFRQLRFERRMLLGHNDVSQRLYRLLQSPDLAVSAIRHDSKSSARGLQRDRLLPVSGVERRIPQLLRRTRSGLHSKIVRRLFGKQRRARRFPGLRIQRRIRACRAQSFFFFCSWWLVRSLLSRARTIRSTRPGRRRFRTTCWTAAPTRRRDAGVAFRTPETWRAPVLSAGCCPAQM
jgi:hypothetical protein